MSARERPASGRRTLAELRRTAALAHALRDVVAEVWTPCGRCVYASYCPFDRVSMTPCALRKAVCAAWQSDRDARRLALLLGLPPAPLRARLLEDGSDERHVGLGVFRFARGADCGFAFASILPLEQVERAAREAIGDVRAEGGDETVLEGAAVTMVHDPELETTVVFVAFAREVEGTPEAFDVAARIAAACGAAEVAALDL